jgi:DNA-binding response OmpR family regulator
MKKKILLIDDDPSVREILTQVLLDEQYTVIPTACGERGWAIAATTKVDLVLLDLNLPAQSGWETFAQLTSQHPEVPIIVITGRPNQVFTALAAGAGALLEKPLELACLLDVMKRLLAEPAEANLARLTGRPAEFDYFPAQPETASTSGVPPVADRPGPIDT